MTDGQCTMNNEQNGRLARAVLVRHTMDVRKAEAGDDALDLRAPEPLREIAHERDLSIVARRKIGMAAFGR